MEKETINNLLGIVASQGRRMDTLSKRIDLANKRIDRLQNGIKKS